MLSMHKLELVRPEYANVIKPSFHWHVFNWKVEEEFPDVVDLLMETCNLGQQHSMDETPMQVAMKLYNTATQHVYAKYRYVGRQENAPWESNQRRLNYLYH